MRVNSKIHFKSTLNTRMMFGQMLNTWNTLTEMARHCSFKPNICPSQYVVKLRATLSTVASIESVEGRASGCWKHTERAI